MKIHSLHRRQLVRQPLEKVFEFFARPENLSMITPRSMNFSILTPSPLVMKEGALIDYTVTIVGTGMRWTTLITEYQPPHCFIDVQLRGPYSYWHHKHTFYETDEGTMIEDEIRYAMPFGFLGEIVHSLFVGRTLNNIFDHRMKTIRQLFPDLGLEQMPGYEELLKGVHV